MKLKKAIGDLFDVSKLSWLAAVAWCLVGYLVLALGFRDLWWFTAGSDELANKLSLLAVMVPIATANTGYRSR